MNVVLYLCIMTAQEIIDYLQLLSWKDRQEELKISVSLGNGYYELKELKDLFITDENQLVVFHE